MCVGLYIKRRVLPKRGGPLISGTLTGVTNRSPRSISLGDSRVIPTIFAEKTHKSVKLPNFGEYDRTDFKRQPFNSVSSKR